MVVGDGVELGEVGWGVGACVWCSVDGEFGRGRGLFAVCFVGVGWGSVGGFGDVWCWSEAGDVGCMVEHFCALGMRK